MFRILTCNKKFPIVQSNSNVSMSAKWKISSSLPLCARVLHKCLGGGEVPTTSTRDNVNLQYKSDAFNTLIYIKGELPLTLQNWCICHKCASVCLSEDLGDLDSFLDSHSF